MQLKKQCQKIHESAKNELNKIKEIEKTLHRKNLYLKTNKYAYNFQNFGTIITFGRDIYNGAIATKVADNDQSALLVKILNFKKQLKSKSWGEKQLKEDVLQILYSLFEDRERVLSAFDSKIFPIKIEGTDFSDKVSDHSNLKILTPKQMLQRLPIALVNLKAGNTSENLLNQNRQIMYSLNWAKRITRKIYNHIMNVI